MEAKIDAERDREHLTTATSLSFDCSKRERERDRKRGRDRGGKSVCAIERDRYKESEGLRETERNLPSDYLSTTL